MKRTLSVKIDHVGMFSNLFHPATAMFELGFSGEGGCTTLPMDKDNLPPRCMRFVMDNCYLEFAINRDPKKYGGATHGINYFEFASTDIVKTRDSALANGFHTSDLVYANRYADHGEKKGTAYFECVALLDDIIPNIEVESVCHKTRELFYDNNRYLHKNKISRVSEIILCCADEEKVTKIEKQLAKFDQGLGDWGEGTAIRKLTFFDPDSLLEDFGVHVPADYRNTGGIVLQTSNYDETAAFLKKAKSDARETEKGLVIDLVDSQNIFLFIPKHR